MQVACTTSLLKELKRELKKDERFKGYKLAYVKLSRDSYNRLVDIYDWNHEEDIVGWNQFRVIVVKYPSEFYACDKYITTKDVERCFKYSDKTLEGLLNSLKDMIEI